MILQLCNLLYFYQTAVTTKLASTGTEGTWWWIKGDRWDVLKGVWESTKGEWSGDVDLNDGQLEYKEQLQWTEGIGLKEVVLTPQDVTCRLH